MLNLPWRMWVGQGAKLSVNEKRLRVGWCDKQTSQSWLGQMVDTGAGLMGQRAVVKTELAHLAGVGANQTES
jgi:hypothetical protein